MECMIGEMLSLPKSIELVLFKKLGAKYCQTPEDVMETLESTPEQNKLYLGTYFPRTFFEAYTTLYEINKIPIIREMIRDKKNFYILDIGSGVGGYALGLIWAINEIHGHKTINLLSIDGDEEKLEIQKEIFNLLGMDVNISTLTKLFTSDDFQDNLTELSKYKFDIVVASKFIVEIIRSQTKSPKRRLYQEFLSTIENQIFEIGPSIVIINEITEPITNGKKDYVPYSINRESHWYQKNPKSKLMCILPACCALWHNECKDPGGCFSQKHLEINHRGPYMNGELFDDFNFFFKVFIRKTDGNKIIESLDKKKPPNCMKIFYNNCCRHGHNHNTDECDCTDDSPCVNAFSADIYMGD